MNLALVSLGCGVIAGLISRLLINAFSFECVFSALRKAARRWTSAWLRSKVEEQWPPALDLLSGALQSGLSLEEGLTIVASESPEPLKTVLANTLGTEAQWLPLKDRVSRLFQTPDLLPVRALLLMSHETGGKVTPLIDTKARLMRRKIEMKAKIKALTAQGRFSAWVVGLSPFVLLATLQFLSPDATRVFYSTRIGGLLLGLVVVLVTAGVYVVHRLARMDV